MKIPYGKKLLSFLLVLTLVSAPLAVNAEEPAPSPNETELGTENDSEPETESPAGEPSQSEASPEDTQTQDAETEKDQNIPDNITAEAASIEPASSLGTIKGLFENSTLASLVAARLNLENGRNSFTVNSTVTAAQLAAIKGLNGDGTGISSLKGISYLTSVTSISFENCSISDLSPLQGMSSLKMVNLKGNKISSITALGTLANLESLWLENNQITSISALSGLSKLRHLYLNGNSISVTSALSGIPALETLNLSGNKSVNVSYLNGLKDQLTYLDLSDTAIANFSSFPVFTKLTYLNIDNTKITDLSALSNCRSIRELNISNNSVTSLSPLSVLTELIVLEAENNKITSIDPVKGLTKLIELNISSNQISSLSPVSGLSKLYGLFASQNSISDLSPLSGLASLDTLVVSYNNISNLAPLKSVTSLGNLSINKNNISDISPLASLKSLRMLEMNQNKVSDLSPLSGLAYLSDLDIRMNQVADLSPLSKLKLYLFYGTGQTVTLSQLKYAGTAASVKNTATGRAGKTLTPSSITKSGSYNSSLNTVSFMGLSGSGNASYTYGELVYLEEDGIAQFSGTVTIPYSADKTLAAAPSAVSAKKASYNSNTVSWTKPSSGSPDGYIVYYSTSSGGTYQPLTWTSGTSYTHKSLNTGTTYYYKIAAYKNVTGITYFSPLSSIVNAKPALDTPGSFKAAADGTASVKVSWSSVSGASGYEVWYASSKNGTYKKAGTTTSASYTQKNLTSSTTYYFKVRAYRSESGSTVYSSYTSIKSAATNPGKVSGVKVSANGASQLKVSWNKCGNATGYEIWYKSSKNGTYKKLKTTAAKTTSYTYKKAVPGKTYYFKVRAVNKISSGTKYGSYSAVKTKKATVPKSSKLTVKNSGRLTAKVSWKKVSNATGYKIYRATSKNGKYKLISTTKKTSLTNKKLKKGTTYYYKVRAYKKINGKTYYSSYTSKKSVKIKK